MTADTSLLSPVRRAPDETAWLDPPEMPLDLNGPDDRPFTLLPPNAAERPLIDLFRAVADQEPGGLALDDGTDRLTYAQAWTLARRIAAAVAAATPSGAVVGVALPVNVLLPLGLLGVMGAGRIVVPIDLHAPPQRWTELLEVSGAALLLLDGPQLRAAFPDDVAVLDLRSLLDAADEPGPMPPAGAADAFAPAIILYTSGTTGRPKGIVNSQAALTQRVALYLRSAHLAPGDRMVSLSTPCNISGVREVLTGLLAGATVHLVEPRGQKIGATSARLAAIRPTLLFAVTTLVRAICREPASAAALSALRVLRLGGEPTHWSDLAEARRSLPSTACIMAAYSSTEAICSHWFVPPDAAPSGATVPAGYVEPGSRYRIVDEAGVPVPEGAEGILVLRGRYVALGHWQDGRCVPGPMQPDPDDPLSRIFVTGDRARLGPDGLLRLLGRADGMVKIAGQRVEPAEVEAVLRGWSEVADAAVIVHRGPEGRASLLGFVVPRMAVQDLPALLRSRLRASLPPALQPARLHLLPSLPMTANAKLDRAALARLDADFLAAAEKAPAQAAPPEIDWAVREAWARSFGRRSARADESFEAAGGDSLKLLRLIYDIEQRLGAFTFLPLDLFTTGMRPSDMARAIAQAGQSAGASTADGRPTLFLMPGLNGDEPLLALFRADLAGALHCVTLAYPEWRDVAAAGADLDALADGLADAIARQAGTEPVRLAGYSFGAGVAYAVAQRLCARGVTVALLGLIEPPPAWLDPSLRGPALREALAGQGVMRQALQERRFQDVLGLALAETLSRPTLAPLLRRAASWRSLPLPLRLRFSARAWLRSFQRAGLLRAWQARPGPRLPGSVPAVLFRGSEHASDQPHDLGWSSRCAALRVVDVPGSHHGIFEAGNRALLAARFVDAVRGP